VPIFRKDDLKLRDHGALDPHEGVAPGAEGAAAPHVFVTDIQPAEKPDTAVRDHGLAVIAEVDLEPPGDGAAPPCVRNPDAGLLHLAQEAPAQDGPEHVIGQPHLDATPRRRDQAVGDGPPHFIVAVDIELDEQVALRGIYRLEHRVEGVLPVDQHLGAVATNDGQARHGLECAEIRGQRVVMGGLGPVAAVVVEQGPAFAPRPRAGGVAVRANKRVDDHGEVGRGQQEHDPTHRRLRGPRRLGRAPRQPERDRHQ
jgi:hypothetical protein